MELPDTNRETLFCLYAKSWNPKLFCCLSKRSCFSTLCDGTFLPEICDTHLHISKFIKTEHRKIASIHCPDEHSFSKTRYSNFIVKLASFENTRRIVKPRRLKCFCDTILHVPKLSSEDACEKGKLYLFEKSKNRQKPRVVNFLN